MPSARICFDRLGDPARPELLVGSLGPRTLKVPEITRDRVAELSAQDAKHPGPVIRAGLRFIAGEDEARPRRFCEIKETGKGIGIEAVRLFDDDAGLPVPARPARFVGPLVGQFGLPALSETKAGSA